MRNVHENKSSALEFYCITIINFSFYTLIDVSRNFRCSYFANFFRETYKNENFVKRLRYKPIDKTIPREFLFSEINKICLLRVNESYVKLIKPNQSVNIPELGVPELYPSKIEKIKLFIVQQRTYRGGRKWAVPSPRPVKGGRCSPSPPRTKSHQTFQILN